MRKGGRGMRSGTRRGVERSPRERESTRLGGERRGDTRAEVDGGVAWREWGGGGRGKVGTGEVGGIGRRREAEGKGIGNFGERGERKERSSCIFSRV